LDLDPGAGSAPDARAELRPAKGELPREWRSCWESYGDFLLDAVPKDRALSAQPWYGRLTSQEIHLGIQPADCEPLEGEVRSPAHLRPRDCHFCRRSSRLVIPPGSRSS